MLFKNNKVILAPMAGITDPVFRCLCKEYGADIVVSEMVSADGILYGSKATIALAEFQEQERPIGVQLFGSDPDHLARAAAFIQRNSNPDFIDLNSGCPVPKVVKKNGGSALLQNAKLFEKIVSAMVKSVSIPVTVKIRSGWHKFNWVDVEFAQMAEAAGASAVIVHPRSQTMGFSGHSYWERIYEVKKSVGIPVIGNGDVLFPGDALRMFDETGCDSIMIGRGAYGNPWIFGQIKDALNGIAYRDIPPLIKLETALKHLLEFARQYGERSTVREMKKHLAWYIKGMTGASAGRDLIFRSQTMEELTGALSTLMDSLKRESIC
ncbi:MAG: tRNA dihydrouridine synthase DusB [Fibrobacter sp.]|nr:tRNA dihydrouridine synthase DusB [Fibrobacter sp.]